MEDKDRGIRIDINGIDMNGIRYESEWEQNEKKAEAARQERLQAYAEAIQKRMTNHTEEVVKELVAERHRQGLTQNDIAERTGMKASNIARLENGSGIPTLVVLEKYASALGKHIEVKIL